MKKKMIIGMGLWISLQLVKFLLLKDYELSYGTGRIAIKLDQQPQIRQEIQFINGDKEGYIPALAASRENVNLCAAGETEKVEVAAVNFMWQQTARVKMTEGAFWGQEADKDERNLVVISDELAMKLWKSQKVTGNEIKLDEVPYQIAGVYKKYKHFNDYRFKTEQESVYIPLKSQLSQKWETQFAVFDKAGHKVLPEKGDLSKWGISDGLVSNREDWLRKMYSSAWIPVLVLSLIFTKRVIWQMKKVIWLPDTAPVRKMGLLAGAAVLIGLLLLIGLRGIYISPSGLPGENIFDMTAYWKQMQAEWQKHNAFVSSSFNEFEEALYLLKNTLTWINSLQIIITGTLLVEDARQSVDSGKNFAKQIKQQ